MSQGYVGITNNFTRRTNFHLKYCYDNPHLGQAIAKYQDIVVDIVFEGTEGECKCKESELRPSRLIGWNIAEGGGMPPSLKGTTWSDDRRKRYLKTITENQSNYRSSNQRRQGILTRKQNGYVEGKNLNINSIIGTTWWTNGTDNKRCKAPPGPDWIMGRTKFKKYGTEKQCPRCGVIGRGAGMVRFHFDNCKENRGEQK